MANNLQHPLDLDVPLAADLQWALDTCLREDFATWISLQKQAFVNAIQNIKELDYYKIFIIMLNALHILEML